MLLEMTLNQINQENRQANMIKSIGWSISVICRVKPLPHYDYVYRSLCLLVDLINYKRISDQTIVSSILWAICYFSTNNEKSNNGVDKIQNIINLGLVPELMSILTGQEQS